LHLQKIKDTFKDSLIEFDSKKLTKIEIFTRVKMMLEIHPTEKLAYRPPSLAILGQPCSDTEEIADYFSSR